LSEDELIRKGTVVLQSALFMTEMSSEENQEIEIEFEKIKSALPSILPYPKGGTP
jgi:CRISPR/Cas system-associated endoribonuclease Cas2